MTASWVSAERCLARLPRHFAQGWTSGINFLVFRIVQGHSGLRCESNKNTIGGAMLNSIRTESRSLAGLRIRRTARVMAVIALLCGLFLASSQPASAGSATIILAKKSAAVTLDGRQRTVYNKCLVQGSPDHPWCVEWGVVIGRSTEVRFYMGGEGEGIKQEIRAIKATSSVGLLAVSLEHTPWDQDWRSSTTYLAKIYRYKDGRLIQLRNLKLDHIRYHGARMYYSKTPSTISSVTNLSGGRVKVTWRTNSWSCTNSSPSITYRYTDGQLKVVSWVGVGRCA